ncbi:hypothetical protein GCT19_09695 [Paraburkholderia sp. CNPSo 3155]|uniref:hypothetical protein n=1 Tax=Paraburkholderia atlantica TaxID=2654982 RepID=UPI000399DA85|nr:hypothetical protein [Paraburkholderia atlantica]MPW05914.1 hypothetical protein [Paraburkholderia atlantica]NUY33802.1 hypothetical protein [Paraburkholderia atlantica]
MDGLSRTRHWAWGAVIVVLCSFAYAKGPGGPHGGGADSHHAGGHPPRMEMRGDGHYADAGGAHGPRGSRDPMVARDSRAQRGNPNIADANFGYGFGSYKSGMRRVGDPSSYAGAITPVSAESRPVPHPPSNMPMRNGSIRADVARYNEERGAPRPMQRPADDPRQPGGSPYRN